MFFVTADCTIDDSTRNRPHCLKYRSNILSRYNSIMIRIISVKYHYRQLGMRKGYTAKFPLLIFFKDVDAYDKLLKSNESVFISVVDFEHFVKDDIGTYFEESYT